MPNLENMSEDAFLKRHLMQINAVSSEQQAQKIVQATVKSGTATYGGQQLDKSIANVYNATDASTYIDTLMQRVNEQTAKFPTVDQMLSTAKNVASTLAERNIVTQSLNYTAKIADHVTDVTILSSVKPTVKKIVPNTLKNVATLTTSVVNTGTGIVENVATSTLKSAQLGLTGIADTVSGLVKDAIGKKDKTIDEQVAEQIIKDFSLTMSASGIVQQEEPVTLQSIANKSLDKTLSVSSQLVNSGLSIVAKTTDVALDTAQKIVNNVLPVVSSTLEVVSNLAEAGSDLVCSVLDTTGKVVDKVMNATITVATKILDATGKVVDQVLQVGGKVIGKLLDVGTNVLTVVGNTVSKVLDAGSAIMNKILVSVANTAGKLTSFAMNTVAKVGNIANKVISTAGSVVGKVTSAAFAMAGNTLNTLTGITKNVLGTVGNITSNIAVTAGNILSSVAATGLTVAGAAAKMVLSAAGSVLGTTLNGVSGASGLLYNTTSGLSRIANTALKTAGVSTALIGSTLSPTLNSAVYAYSSGIRGYGLGTLSESLFKNTITSVGSQSLANGGSALTSSSYAIPTMASVLSSVLNPTGSSLNSGWINYSNSNLMVNALSMVTGQQASNTGNVEALANCALFLTNQPQKISQNLISNALYNIGNNSETINNYESLCKAWDVKLNTDLSGSTTTLVDDIVFYTKKIMNSDTISQAKGNLKEAYDYTMPSATGKNIIDDGVVNPNTLTMSYATIVTAAAPRLTAAPVVKKAKVNTPTYPIRITMKKYPMYTFLLSNYCGTENCSIITNKNDENVRYIIWVDQKYCYALIKDIKKNDWGFVHWNYTECTTKLLGQLVRIFKYNVQDEHVNNTFILQKFNKLPIELTNKIYDDDDNPKRVALSNLVQQYKIQTA